MRHVLHQVGTLTARMTDNGATKIPTHSMMFLYAILKQYYMARIFGRKILHSLSSINPDALTQGVNRTENVGDSETILLEGEPLTFQNKGFVVSREVFAKGESPA